MCTFSEAWIGKCKRDGEPFCDKHTGLVCSSCGALATQTCAETMGLVCGADLCGDCEHEIAEDGTNGYSLRHCKKTEQKYLPWYARKRKPADGDARAGKEDEK